VGPDANTGGHANAHGWTGLSKDLRGELLGTFAASRKRLFPRTAALADGTTTGPEASALDALALEGHGLEGHALEGADFADEAALYQEATDEELLDFLAADIDPVPADPAFREKLRDELWEMVADGRVGRRNDH
jgi:hypothetical protein